MFDGVEGAPENRFVDKWSRPKEIAPGITWAIRILVPWDSPDPRIKDTDKDKEKDKDIIWIPCAPEPFCVEISVVFLRPPHARIAPMSAATEFGVVATEPLGNGEVVQVFYQRIPWPRMSEQPEMALRFFRGRGPKDLLPSESLRTLAYAEDSNGVRVVLDARVELAPSAIDKINRARDRAAKPPW